MKIVALALLAATLGGCAVYPAPVAVAPAPVYAAPVSRGIGGYCSTPVRTCQLINVAEVGSGCSCSVAGGRARGAVVP